MPRRDSVKKSTNLGKHKHLDMKFGKGRRHHSQGSEVGSFLKYNFYYYVCV